MNSKNIKLTYKTKIYILANENGNSQDYKCLSFSWYEFDNVLYKVQDINLQKNLYKIQISNDMNTKDNKIILGCIDQNQKFYRLEIENLIIKDIPLPNRLYLILEYNQNEDKFVIHKSSHYNGIINCYEEININIQYWINYQNNEIRIGALATKGRIKNSKEQNNEERKSAQFESKEEFLEWYKEQSKICCYCGIKEEYLELYFNDKNCQYFFDQENKARQRGRYLEVERVVTLKDKNVYSKENCALTCYVCNNAKSDFLSPKSFKPIARGINAFWNETLKKSVKYRYKSVDFPEKSKIWDK